MATIQKRGNSYSIRVSCGYDTKGRQVIQSMTWKPEPTMTPRQVEKELNRQSVMFEEQCLKGYQSKAIKFEEFAEQWFEEYAKPNLRNTTYERMLQLRGRVYAAIGHLRMDKITPRQIQAFVNTLSKDGANERTGKPLAPKTIRHNLSLISDVFSYAVKVGVAADNPCSKVTLPKDTPKEKKIYTREEVERFLTLLNSEPLKYRVFFNLLIYSGFRRGEMLGLEWKDIDFENEIISVRRTSNYTKANGYYTDTTKTRKSQRSLKFPDLVMNLLKELRADQERQAQLLGSKWVNSDRLFIKDDGQPLFCGMPYLWLERFCKKHDMPFHGLHSIRHFFASSLIHANVDIAAVSSALGHSAITTTSSIYLHAFQDANARASEAIAAVLDFSKKKKPDTDDGGLQDISGARRLDLSEKKNLSLLIDIENAFNNIQGSKRGLEQWAASENLRRAAETYNYLSVHCLTSREALDEKITLTKKSKDDSLSRIKEIEARLKVIKEDIENIDNYRRTKDAAHGLKTAVSKDKYRREHDSELIIHDAAVKYIRKRFPDGKLPMIKDLRTEEKELKAEKNRLYESYYKAKDELSELRTAEKNLAELLGQARNEPGRTESRKKNDELE